MPPSVPAIVLTGATSGMRSQRWDALTGLPPAGTRIVKEADANP
jgi:hypothetical protein